MPQTGAGDIGCEKNSKRSVTGELIRHCRVHDLSPELSRFCADRGVESAASSLQPFLRQFQQNRQDGDTYGNGYSDYPVR